MKLLLFVAVMRSLFVLLYLPLVCMWSGVVFLTHECAHAHERVIAIVDFSLGRSVGWLVGWFGC